MPRFFRLSRRLGFAGGSVGCQGEKNPLKISFVIPGGGGGGVRSVVRIAAGLAERGHSIRVLFRSPPATLRDRLRRAYLRVRFNQRNDWLRSFPGEVIPYRRLSASVVEKNDLIIGVGVSCVLEIAELPDWCGVKVHNSRGVEPWIPEQMDAAWRLHMPRIVVGAHLIQRMRESGSTDRAYVAHNGLDHTAYFPSLPAGSRRGVGAVFHGGGVKNPGMMMDVFRRLSEARPDIPLHSFGSFPRPKHMPRRVRYVRLPRLAQARDIYSRCLVWFLTSRNEGLPNPLLEAMACGCSVVSTDCGGARDIIDPGRSGLLVAVDDVEGMVENICHLTDNPGRRSGLTMAAKEILQRFTWPKAVATFEAALRDILDQQAAPQESHHSALSAPAA